MVNISSDLTTKNIILDIGSGNGMNTLSLSQKNPNNFLVERDNTIKNEALSALSSLGISKNVVNNHIDRVLDNNNNISLEDLIREVLKRS